MDSANRLRRWAVILSNYNYEICYVKSENNLADSLSRLPVKDDGKCLGNFDVDYVQYFSDKVDFKINFEVVKQETRFDSVLFKIMIFVKNGWPKYAKTDSKFKEYYVIKNELTVEEGVILWNHRIVIPLHIRAQMLAHLHKSHLGMTKMKSLARSYFFGQVLIKTLRGWLRIVKIVV